jgi:Mannose-6-phosphate isomerase
VITVNKAKYEKLAETGELLAMLEKQGLSVFSWRDPPGATYAEHCHSHDEVIVVARGAIEFTIGGQSYLLEAGDELILPEGTRHSAVNRGSVTVEYFICS